MIDYDTPDDDPIVAEVRRAREGYAARFDFDLTAICADLKRREESSGRKYVCPPARWPQPPKAAAETAA